MKIYVAEVGRFSAKGNRPTFERLLTGIPPAERTYIGRAVGDENQFCPVVIGKGRPNYNGEKLLIPNDMYSQYVSRTHGKLTDYEGEGEVTYTHLGAHGTTLWTPKFGILSRGDVLADLAVKNAEFDIDLDDVYLLLGAQYPPPYGAKNLEDRFPDPSYYVRLTREGSR